MMGERLYTGFSFSDLAWTLVLRLACVFGVIYSLSHYTENPVLITIVAAVCGIFILIIGNDEIVIYQDRVTQTTNSFASLIFNSKGKTYRIEDIKSAYGHSPAPSTPLEIGVVVLLSTLIKKRKTKIDSSQPIYFDLKSGQTVKFDTNLGDDKAKRIIELVNSLKK